MIGKVERTSSVDDESFSSLYEKHKPEMKETDIELIEC